MNALSQVGITALLIASGLGLAGSVASTENADRRIRGTLWMVGVLAVVVAVLALAFGGAVAGAFGRDSEQLSRLGAACYWTAGALAAAGLVIGALQQIGYRRDAPIAYASWVTPTAATLLALAVCWALCGIAAGPHSPSPIQLPGS